jgi:hypothetical protein
VYNYCIVRTLCRLVSIPLSTVCLWILFNEWPQNTYALVLFVCLTWLFVLVRLLSDVFLLFFHINCKIICSERYVLVCGWPLLYRFFRFLFLFPSGRSSDVGARKCTKICSQNKNSLNIGARYNLDWMLCEHNCRYLSSKKNSQISKANGAGLCMLVDVFILYVWVGWVSVCLCVSHIVYGEHYSQCGFFFHVFTSILYMKHEP